MCVTASNSNSRRGRRNRQRSTAVGGFGGDGTGGDGVGAIVGKKGEIEAEDSSFTGNGGDGNGGDANASGKLALSSQEHSFPLHHDPEQQTHKPVCRILHFRSYVIM